MRHSTTSSSLTRGNLHAWCPRLRTRACLGFTAAQVRKRSLKTQCQRWWHTQHERETRTPLSHHIGNEDHVALPDEVTTIQKMCTVTFSELLHGFTHRLLRPIRCRHKHEKQAESSLMRAFRETFASLRKHARPTAQRRISCDTLKLCVRGKEKNTHTKFDLANASSTHLTQRQPRHGAPSQCALSTHLFENILPATTPAARRLPVHAHARHCNTACVMDQITCNMQHNKRMIQRCTSEKLFDHSSTQEA